MILHLLDSYCFHNDMTPIKDDESSIDDLNIKNNKKKTNMMMCN